MTASLGQWLEQQRFSRPFIDRLIVPQASAVWSADPRQMWAFPARFLAEFFDNHGMLSFRGRPRWRTVTGGSARYVEALVRGSHRPPAPEHARQRRCAAAIERRARDPTRRRARAVRRGRARHPLRPGALAADGRRRCRAHEILSSIPYQPNEAVLHTDTSLLPCRRRAWASWNYHLLPEPSGLTTVTYHMNRLQALRADREFCVTLNRTAEIAPEHIIRTIAYAHPVYTAARAWRPNAATTRSAAATGPTSAAPTGAGAFTRTAW